jgi:hypothetical protein
VTSVIISQVCGYWILIRTLSTCNNIIYAIVEPHGNIGENE